MRFYYRCGTCLAAFTVEKEIPRHSTTYRLAAECDCGGQIERLGRVFSGLYGTDKVACKCDARCTHAQGPNCDCQCNGENHGAGMAGYEVEFRADGKAVYRPPDGKAKARATEFRAELARAEEVARKLHESLPNVPDHLRNKASLTNYRFRKTMAKAKGSASHPHRLKVLREWMTEAAKFFTPDFSTIQ